MRYHGKDEVSGSNPDRGSKFALESAIWRFFLVRSINNSASAGEKTNLDESDYKNDSLGVIFFLLGRFCRGG